MPYPTHKINWNALDTRKSIPTPEQINWTNAKRQLRKAGFYVNVSLKSCRLGCIGCADIPESDKPKVYTTRNRFDSELGGYLYHESLGDTEHAETFVQILTANNISFDWDKSDAHTIKIDLERTLA